MVRTFWGSLIAALIVIPLAAGPAGAAEIMCVGPHGATLYQDPTDHSPGNQIVSLGPGEPVALLDSPGEDDALVQWHETRGWTYLSRLERC